MNKKNLLKVIIAVGASVVIATALFVNASVGDPSTSGKALPEKSNKSASDSNESAKDINESVADSNESAKDIDESVADSNESAKDIDESVADSNESVEDSNESAKDIDESVADSDESAKDSDESVADSTTLGTGLGESSKTSAASTERAFTLNQLKSFNGQNGQPAYVAYKGVVYDLTAVSNWSSGKHNGVSAGTDVTKVFSSSPHAVSILKMGFVVGKLVSP